MILQFTTKKRPIDKISIRRSFFAILHVRLQVALLDKR